MDSLTWVLVADSANAKLFSTHKAKLFQSPTDQDLQLIEQFSHAESRKKDSELVSDKQGRFGTGTFVEATDPQAHEMEVFSREVSRALDIAHHEKKFRDLILIAPPHFMGLINKHISEDTSRTISLRIEKDYMHFSNKQLIEQLQDYL